MPPKAKAKPEGSKKKKKNSEPTQVNPNGTRVKILGADGKFRWGWQ